MNLGVRKKSLDVFLVGFADLGVTPLVPLGFAGFSGVEMVLSAGSLDDLFLFGDDESLGDCFSGFYLWHNFYFWIFIMKLSLTACCPVF